MGGTKAEQAQAQGRILLSRIEENKVQEGGIIIMPN